MARPPPHGGLHTKKARVPSRKLQKESLRDISCCVFMAQCPKRNCKSLLCGYDKGYDKQPCHFCTESPTLGTIPLTICVIEVGITWIVVSLGPSKASLKRAAFPMQVSVRKCLTMHEICSCRCPYPLGKWENEAVPVWQENLLVLDDWRDLFWPFCYCVSGVVLR